MAVFTIDEGNSSGEEDDEADCVDEGNDEEGRDATVDDVSLASEIESFDDGCSPQLEKLFTEIWSWRRQPVHMQ